MEMDIGNYISTLLYENKTVALPGLGSFEAAYQPALIDQVQGALHPPGKTISFNANLVGDDGLLVGMIQDRYALSANDAAQMLEGYVHQIREAIAGREIVVFPKVGRLYKDYENNLQFLPDGNNYDIDSYGLPTVNFYPVARSSRTPPVKAAPKKKVVRPVVPKAAEAANNGLIAAIAAATIVVGVAVYFLIFGADQQQEQGMQPVPTSRVNVRPGDDEEATAQPEEPSTPSREEEKTALQEDPAGSDTERPTPAPGQQSYVIIVGVFGNPENVKNLIDDIYDAGYEPYTEKAGSLTKVGVQRTYRSEAEIEAAIQDVRKRFTKDAKLYRW
ncbi:MAG: SPOR domain-containing protein [Phaeodactylibacter sp.]|uniref:HU domain-containing protein n=1 Tax=Phaeodactylibacter sp. TaxID=1940289 RepID=UPI0032EDE55A